MTSKKLKKSQSQVQMEKEEKQGHQIYFNRGVAGSQAYVRKFGNKKPHTVGSEAYEWLSRGLFEALVSFIREANGVDWSVHAAVYEFQLPSIVNEFKLAIDRGVDVKIVFDCKHENEFDKYGEPIGPWEKNLEAIDNGSIPKSCLKARKTNPSFIAHNKFIVLIQNDVPKSVWTGSTNLTEGGIFGHSNVGHLVRNESVASAYEMYWQQLNGDPTAAKLRPWNIENSPVPIGTPTADSVQAIFSPRTTLEALKWYVSRMEAANTATFLTAAFGVHDFFEDVFLTQKNNLRYLMLESEDEDMEKLRSWKYNRISIGNVLGENKFEHWLAESLTGFNRHVKYVHTKYLLN